MRLCGLWIGATFLVLGVGCGSSREAPNPTPSPVAAPPGADGDGLAFQVPVRRRVAQRKAAPKAHNSDGQIVICNRYDAFKVVGGPDASFDIGP